VLKLVPSAQLSANEIAAAALADQGAVFNPQQQFRVSWPAEPVVARAYLDQLERDAALPADVAAEVGGLLDRATAVLGGGAADAGLVARLRALAATLRPAAGDAITVKRKAGLAGTLEGLAQRLAG